MQGLKSMLLKEQQYLETICSKAEEELKSSRMDACVYQKISIKLDIIIARQIVTGLIFQAMTWS